MAKLLFFNIPAYGHVNPTLPVVTELVQRGHRVIYCNSDSFGEDIHRTGAEFRSYPDSSTSEADLAKTINNLVDVVLYILEECLRLLPFCLNTIERENPDRVIFDSNALWGLQAASLKNISSAASVCTLILDGARGIGKWLDYPYMFGQAFTRLLPMYRLRRRLLDTYGPRVFPDKAIFSRKGDMNIVYTSREFQPNTSFINESFHFVGPSILASTRNEIEFCWDCLDPERNKIYLSLGTLYNDNIEFYRTVFKAFSDHPAQFILSTGRNIHHQVLESIPDNFIIQSFVPQLELLQKVNLFITHGGMNSINESLYFGVPMVVVPQQLEQAMNGRQVARQGAGIVMADTPPFGKINAFDLRRTVNRILTDPAYRQNADRLKQSFQQAGGYQRAATIITSGLSD